MKPQPMPRFAISRHDWPNTHWDFFLETDTVCETWRLSSEPCWNTRILAEKNSDHRLHYLEYSGPVSGGRGTVTPVWIGEYDKVPGSDWEIYVKSPQGCGHVRMETDSEGRTWATFRADVE